MCGIAGIISESNSYLIIQRLTKMLDVMKSRGPDSSGQWQQGKVFFGHNRLAIHDLSSDGHQPMATSDSEHCLIFNGEIYNYRTLKLSLEAEKYPFVGNSDTEVLLACLACWGLKQTLTKIDGMFSFAYWQKKNNKVYIARDRMGEKPLYYHQAINEFIFSSELKGIVTACERQLELDPLAVQLYLQNSYIPAPYSIYKGVMKLLPGHYLELSLDAINSPIKCEEYFSILLSKNEEELTPLTFDKLQTQLIESVGQCLDADVPVGAFLSGGIDSSLICAIAKKELSADIHAHTIGFAEKEFDESPYAAEVAKHLGFEQHIHQFSQSDMLSILPQMMPTYDEPFADPSQLATYLLCQKTKEHVTVALSGDAGDELFGGYSRYHISLARWEKISKLPYALRHLLSSLDNCFGATLDRMNFAVSHKEKVRRGIRYWGSKDFKQFYRDSISYDWRINITYASLPADSVPVRNTLQYLMKVDALQYLPDCILTKVDRASMAHSLEVRVPLLAKNILDTSRQYTNEQLIQNNRGKWPLREVLYKYVPESLIERPKRGFAVPLKFWFLGQLKSWAESLIYNDKLLDALPFVDHNKYQLYWFQHQQQRYDWSGQLWIYLQLLSWLESHQKGV